MKLKIFFLISACLLFICFSFTECISTKLKAKPAPLSTASSSKPASSSTAPSSKPAQSSVAPSLPSAPSSSASSSQIKPEVGLSSVIFEFFSQTKNKERVTEAMFGTIFSDAGREALAKKFTPGNDLTDFADWQRGLPKLGAPSFYFKDQSVSNCFSELSQKYKKDPRATQIGQYYKTYVIDARAKALAEKEKAFKEFEARIKQQDKSKELYKMGNDCLLKTTCPVNKKYRLIE